MRKNEYETLEEFSSEFIGERNPYENHWLGLDFAYENSIYRLHTGSMYNETDTILPDGKKAIFGVYRLINEASLDYSLIGEYSDMNSLLNCCFIEGRKFKDIIMDDNTEILGKD